MRGSEVLRDKYGARIGEIEIDGSKHILHDRYGYRLGTYDLHDGFTRDRYGFIVGRGDLLTTLLE